MMGKECFTIPNSHIYIYIYIYKTETPKSQEKKRKKKKNRKNPEKNIHTLKSFQLAILKYFLLCKKVKVCIFFYLFGSKIESLASVINLLVTNLPKVSFVISNAIAESLMTFSGYIIFTEMEII